MEFTEQNYSNMVQQPDQINDVIVPMDLDQSPDPNPAESNAYSVDITKNKNEKQKMCENVKNCLKKLGKLFTSSSEINTNILAMLRKYDYGEEFKRPLVTIEITRELLRLCEKYLSEYETKNLDNSCVCSNIEEICNVIQSLCSNMMTFYEEATTTRNQETSADEVRGLIELFIGVFSRHLEHTRKVELKQFEYLCKVYTDFLNRFGDLNQQKEFNDILKNYDDGDTKTFQQQQLKTQF